MQETTGRLSRIRESDRLVGGLGPDILRLYLRRLRLAQGVLVGLLAMTVVFAGWYLAEEFYFREVSHDALRRIHFLRGWILATTSVMLAAWAVLRVMRRDEADVRSQQEFLDRVLASSGEAILAVDPEGIVLTWNRRAETLFGYRQSEVAGRKLEEVFRRIQDGPEGMETLIGMARREGGLDRREIRLRSKDGIRKTCAVSANPIRNADGNAVAWAIVCRDITKEKELQYQAITAERLAALGEMAAAVAHEIKNPLAGIKGAMEVVHECLKTCDPEVCAPNLPVIGMIHQQIDRLAHHINDLLLFAKPLRPKPEAFSATALIDHVLTILEREPELKRLEVERRIPAGLAVWGDPHLLQEIVMNLVLNAAQACPERGRLRIEARPGEDEGTELSFEDSGPGLSEAARENLFRPFFTTKSRGTGLGLSICRKIIDAHGGRLDASNAPGGGARFVVGLPAPARSPLGAGSEAETRTAGG